MQLAGSSCGICQQNVLVDSDATWCARCGTVVHKPCLAGAAGRPYDPPAAHFVFSRHCPACFQPNDPPAAECRSCSARTQWDTPAAYAEFLGRMRDTSRVYALRGIAELVVGSFCLLALVACLCLRLPGFRILGSSLIGFLVFTADGFIALTRARRIGRFR